MAPFMNVGTLLLTVLMFGAIIEAFQGKEERKNRIPKGNATMYIKSQPLTNKTGGR